MRDGKFYGVDSDSLRRIRETNKYHEKTYRNRRPRERRGSLPTWQGAMPASLTSNVTAGTEASPSTFTFTLLIPTGSTGLTATGGTTGLTGYNRAAGITVTASGGSPKSAWVTWFNGNWYLLAADC